MDVKATDLSKALRRHVKLLLKDAGFDDVTGRKFWRSVDGKIDTIQISSLSTYRALTDNATTASFHVRLGISLPRYGIRFDPFHRDYVREGPKGPRPDEAQMPIRGVICPAGSPPMKMGRWGWEYKSLWRIDTIEEAEEAALGLEQQFESYALKWLDEDWDLDAILHLLKSEGEKLILSKAENGSHLWLDAGMPSCKIREAHTQMVRNAL